MDPRSQLSGELLQEQVDDRRVQLRHDQSHRRPAGGAHRRQHVQRLPPILAQPPRSRPAPRPNPGERPLLAEPGLVLVPDLDFRVGVLLRDRRELLDDDLLEGVQIAAAQKTTLSRPVYWTGTAASLSLT